MLNFPLAFLSADEDLTTPTSSNTNEDDNSDQPSELDSKIEEGGWHEQSPTPSSAHHQQPSGVREHLQGVGEQGDESLQDDAPLSLTDSDLMRGLLEVRRPPKKLIQKIIFWLFYYQP